MYWKFPIADFARLVGEDPRIAQILERDSGDKHTLDWHQRSWEENRKQVQQHIEAIVATELNRPLPIRISLESVGLAELAYPGIEGLGASQFIGRLASEDLRRHVKAMWPDYLAALLDTLRAAGWSEGDPRIEHRWEDESPLFDRWAARDASGWGAVRFVGDRTRWPAGAPNPLTGLRMCPIKLHHRSYGNVSRARRSNNTGLL